MLKENNIWNSFALRLILTILQLSILCLYINVIKCLSVFSFRFYSFLYARLLLLVTLLVCFFSSLCHLVVRSLEFILSLSFSLFASFSVAGPIPVCIGSLKVFRYEQFRKIYFVFFRSWTFSFWFNWFICVYFIENLLV